jgi:hypothetical protein
MDENPTTPEQVFGNYLGGQPQQDSSLKENEEASQNEAQSTDQETSSAVTEDESTEQETSTQEKSEESSETQEESQAEEETQPAPPLAQAEPEQTATQEEKNEEAQEETEPFDLKGWLSDNQDNLWLYTADLSEVDINNDETSQELLSDSLSDNEGMSDVEVKMYLEDKYPDVFGDDADKNSREYKLQMIDVKREARKYLSQLKEIQTQLEIPNVPAQGDTLSEAVDAEIQKRVEEAQKQNTETYQKMVEGLQRLGDNITKSYDKLSFEIDENSSVEYEPTDEDKKGFKEFLTGYQTYFDTNFVDENGKAKEEQLYKLYLLDKKHNELLKIAKRIGSSEGREDLITKDVKNAAPSGKSTDASKPQVSGNSKSSVLARAILGGNLR